jgi:hypothetical protein
MGVSTSPAVTADPGVYEFLKLHGAEAAFQTVCELVREVYPEARAIQANVFEDWDVPGWMRVRVAFLLPEPLPVDDHVQRNQTFAARIVEKLPPALRELFSIGEEYPPETP